MRSILIRSRVGEDGVLHVDVPPELAGTEVEVTIIPKQGAASGVKGMDDAGWSPGFFEDIVGNWIGDPLVREHEGEYETRRIL